MSKNFNFETDQPLSNVPQKASSMQGFLLKQKIVKNTTQANLLLLCLSLIFLLISLGIILSFQTEPEAVAEPDPDTLI